MITLAEVMALPILRDASVVAGHRGLQGPVRWCHVAEVLDIARLLTGGELLLSTGLALEVPPGRQRAYIGELKQAGVTGLMLELGRQFATVPPALAEAAEDAGLPLIALPFDTPFVRVTETVHTLILSRRGAGSHGLLSTGQAGPQVAAFLTDLLAGRISEGADLSGRLAALGIALPQQPHVAVLVADEPGARLADAAAAEGRGMYWLLWQSNDEWQLVGVAADPMALTASLRNVALRLAPVAAGIGRSSQEPQAAARSLVEARQVVRLRRRRPELDPVYAEAGVYPLVMGGASRDEMRQFARAWLGPLLDYDRMHGTALCQTLRVLLDDALVLAEAAQRLHLTRQAVYHRRDRIAQLLGRRLDDAEVRLALALSLRIWEAAEDAN